MALLAQCLLVMWLARYLDLSMELGSFVAGLQAASRRASPERAVALLAPVRDVFSALFFAAIGLHVYPQFLWREWRVLLALVAVVVLVKLVLGFLVHRLVLRHPWRQAARIAVALAQLSEFAFVVAARAKGLGLVSREVYHLLIGTTALSLLVTPLLWRAVVATLGHPLPDGATDPSSGTPAPALPRTRQDSHRQD